LTVCLHLFVWSVLCRALGAYFEANSGSASVGTVLAQYAVTLTSASLEGAALSMHAAATLTASSVRLPSAGALTISGPAYDIAVDLLGASSFAVLGGSAIVNTVSSLVMEWAACLIETL